MRRGFDRTQRINDVIQKALAQILLEDSVNDFQLVTVLSVNVSKDLSYAKVYVSILSDDETKIKKMLDALNNSAKTLRFELAHQVKLRNVPELKFIYDESTAQGFRISSLIDSAMKKTKE